MTPLTEVNLRTRSPSERRQRKRMRKKLKTPSLKNDKLKIDNKSKPPSKPSKIFSSQSFKIVSHQASTEIMTTQLPITSPTTKVLITRSPFERREQKRIRAKLKMRKQHLPTEIVWG